MIATPILTAIQNNENFSEIKSYEDHLLKDEHKYSFPYCVAYREHKDKIKDLDDGKQHWAYSIRVIFGFKSLESEQEKAETFDEYFENLVKSDPTFGRKFIASTTTGSNIYSEVSGANMFTYLEINLTAEVIK
ncbi:hypothetical protein HNP93_000997 [Methanococcus maripaludis]|uniref:Uncharacterized protein n=1 Tax=Methanococcus maripaludis TaxID=39152 RepID=A0A7J9P6I9_METMI|nr:hypothetical protein [Methanococcus maripaludis]MBA2858296.1 hypothetical protein [Methanococcus maripaludis]